MGTESTAGVKLTSRTYRRLIATAPAGVAELADALVLGASTERCRGSSPLSCTAASDQAPVTDQAPMTNDQSNSKSQAPIGHWILVICWSLGFGHSSFARADTLYIGSGSGIPYANV